MNTNSFPGDRRIASVRPGSPPPDFVMMKPMLLTSLLLGACVLLLLWSSPSTPGDEIEALFEDQGGNRWGAAGGSAPVWLTGLRSVGTLPCPPLPVREHDFSPAPPLRGG